MPAAAPRSPSAKTSGRPCTRSCATPGGPQLLGSAPTRRAEPRGLAAPCRPDRPPRALAAVGSPPWGCLQAFSKLLAVRVVLPEEHVPERAWRDSAAWRPRHGWRLCIAVGRSGGRPRAGVTSGVVPGGGPTPALAVERLHRHIALDATHAVATANLTGEARGRPVAPHRQSRAADEQRSTARGTPPATGPAAAASPTRRGSGSACRRAPSANVVRPCVRPRGGRWPGTGSA